MSSIGSASAGLSYEIGVRIAAKALDVMEMQGEAAVSLIQAAADLQEQVNPSSDPGLGRRIDVTA
jgi:hypothetical protein